MMLKMIRLQHHEGIYEKSDCGGRALIRLVQNRALATSAVSLDKELQERKGISIKQQAMISSHGKEGLPRSTPPSGDICQLDEYLGFWTDSQLILAGAQYAMLNHDIGVIRLRLSPARILPCLAAAARYNHDPSASS